MMFDVFDVLDALDDVECVCVGTVLCHGYASQFKDSALVLHLTCVGGQSCWMFGFKRSWQSRPCNSLKQSLRKGRMGSYRIYHR